MPEVIAMVKGPEKAYKSLVDIGVDLAARTLIRVFHQSFYADCYIGFGGMLSIMVEGRLAEATNKRSGASSLRRSFPVTLLIILLTGGTLFTGTSAP